MTQGYSRLQAPCGPTTRAAPAPLLQARGRLVLQFGLTLLILLAVPHNLLRMLLLLALWYLTFRPLSRSERICFVCTNLLFSTMNYLSMENGIFRFCEPDLLRQPCYELVLWGFYLLHVWRFDQAVRPNPRATKSPPHPLGTLPAWILAALFALSFAVLNRHDLLLACSGACVGAGLLLYREANALRYALHMLAIGVLIEYLGVWRGLFEYTDPPAGGVPPWFLTLWAGVGFFFQRLVVPHLRMAGFEEQPALPGTVENVQVLQP